MIPLLPKGFRAAGIRAPIYKNKPKKLDLAVFLSEKTAQAAGVFTSNRFCASPVCVSRENLKSGMAQAVVANSGCANACTGKRGLKDAQETAKMAARFFSLNKKHVLVASTGVIGEFLPMVHLRQGLHKLSNLLKKPVSRESESGISAASAIMTTDTVPKIAASVFKIGGRTVTIWGCAKGSGMIHPNMATMLSFIFSDAALPRLAMKRMLSSAVKKTFNSLTVDGDTSTNDSVFFLANGLAASLRSHREFAKFEKELEKVCRSLCLQMALDGEGATKVAEILVRGTRTPADAKRIAETIATSPLVKTALFGQDANWGRIFAAAGRSGVHFDPTKVDLRFGDLVVARSGCKADFSEEKAKLFLKEKFIPIIVDLHAGPAQWRYLTCDFSQDYVKINADYRS